MLPERGRDLILAGAILSILVNPFLFALLDRGSPRREAGARPHCRRRSRRRAAAAARGSRCPTTALTDHVVLVGHGRVGSFVSARLRAANVPFLVIETNEDKVAGAAKGRRRGRSPAMPPIPRSRRPPTSARRAACWWRSRTPSRAVRWSSRRAAVNPSLPIIARAHSDAENEHLRKSAPRGSSWASRRSPGQWLRTFRGAPREPVQSAVVEDAGR